MLDPETFWRIKTDANVVPVPPPVRKAKVPPFSMRGVPGNGGGKSKRRLKITPVLG
jgi:hypothetical protein